MLKFGCMYIQGHMNKDHGHDTKLIVQHSTNVKASAIQCLLTWCLVAKNGCVWS
jgi:hypothetical protein